MRVLSMRGGRHDNLPTNISGCEMSRTEIDITDLPDDPEMIEVDVGAPITHDEWTIHFADLSIAMRTDQMMRLRNTLCEHFGSPNEVKE